MTPLGGARAGAGGPVRLGRRAAVAALVALAASAGWQGCNSPPAAPADGGAAAADSAAPAKPAPAPPPGAGALADAAPPAVAVPKAAPDHLAVRRCCEAVRRNGAIAPKQHEAAWKAAREACDRIQQQDAGRGSLADVRAALRGVGHPATCQ